MTTTGGCIFTFLLSLLALAGAQDVSPEDVKCEVCKITVQEMKEAIAGVESHKMLDVGNFRMDADGNTLSKKVPMVKSETYLTDLMEDKICEKLEDYAKVIHKKTKELLVIKLMVNNQMNSIISEVDFVQDGDLNKSLKYYCQKVLEEHEEVFLKAFMSDEADDEDLHHKICSERSNCCREVAPAESYNQEDESEFKEEL